MASSTNNLSGDPSQLSMKDKVALFEENFKGSGAAKPPHQFIANDFLNCIKPSGNEPKTSSNDKKSSSNENVRSRWIKELVSPAPNDSTQDHKKESSSDNNAVTSAPNTSSSNRPTPSSVNSSGSGVQKLRETFQCTNNLPAALPVFKFRRSVDAVLNETRNPIPEILEIFTDLDKFIDDELSELNTNKRVEAKLDGVDMFTLLKNEFYRDKQQHQQEFEQQLKLQKKAAEQFSPIEEDHETEENTSSFNLSVGSQMNRLREKKIQKLKSEAKKQEYILGKVNLLLENLERITQVDERNIEAVVKIERHYLVASSRFQSALTTLRRLNDSSLQLHSRPFHRKGQLIVSEVMLEVKPSYFERRRDTSSRHEFVVVVLKHEDEVYATKAVCIAEDIRTIRFPQTIRIHEAFLDFEIRLEIYGTTFWRQHNVVRSTMLKKYGFATFTLAQTGGKRQRLEMVEVIKSENNPLRKKILLKIRQKITVDVQFSGVLFVKIADLWFKTFAMLVGHLLEISLSDDDSSNPSDNMILDLYNYDSDFAVPVVPRIAKRPYAFMLKFNHRIDDNDFHLLVAAATIEDYAKWVNSINKALVLIK